MEFAAGQYQTVCAYLQKRTLMLLDIMIYLGEFSPATTDVSEPLRRLTSAKAEWT